MATVGKIDFGFTVSWNANGRESSYQHGCFPSSSVTV